MDFTEIITALPSQINIVLVIGLFAIGFMIKHIPALDKVNNNLIPIILPIAGILVSTLTGDHSTTEAVVSAIMSGLVNAAFAVWIHSTGKDIFEMLPGGSNKAA